MSAVINQAYDPLVSPFESNEQEASYNAWLNAKFDASVNDARPNVAHDEAMAKIKLLLQTRATHAAH
jgi:hypothetical protein